MTIYEEAIEKVRNGAKFRIDLREKSLKINGKYLIKKGEWNEEKTLIESTGEDQIEVLKRLYLNYRTSAPSSTSQGNRSYFKALEEDELTDSQLAYSERRSEAQVMLEAYILCKSLNDGDLMKELFGDTNRWFWQAKEAELKEFIILKEWIER